MRRPNVILAGLVFVLCSSAGFAATYEQRVVVQLRAMGYTDITVSFTLLGRAQILAVSSQHTREIVLNPRTGEILRDYAQGSGDSDQTLAPVAVQPIVLGPEPEVSAAVPDVPPDGPALFVADPVVDLEPAVDPVDTLTAAETTPADPAAAGPPEPSMADTTPADTSGATSAATDTSTTGYGVGP